ncbi:MAG TPA: type II secretion system F family protein [Thermoplasmata archaeon]|nr:type II secretion system F family protein [Thermoplasmata archaeon]
MRSALLLAIVLVLALAPLSAALAPGAAGQPSPIGVIDVSPAPGSVTPSTTPTLYVTYSDSGGDINYAAVYINQINFTGFTGYEFTSTSVTCPVPSILALKPGLQNASLVLGDGSGNSLNYTWNFTVNPNASISGQPIFSISAGKLLLYIGIATAVAGATFFAYIAYLKQTTRFAFRKYFATHPIQRSYLVLYIPCAAAFLFLLVGLSYVTGTPNLPAYSLDLVFIGAIFIALTAFGIDARTQLARNRAYERAFAQFLFEMSDAMRGGLDPAKAITELAKTQTNILQRPLRVASDGIRIGRPFEAVLRDMARGLKSPLISRYADLIAEATTVGGETAVVIHRAAKDMDDFVKIEEERSAQLTLPVAVIYIAFAVLVAVLVALLYIAPDLGTLNIGFLTSAANPLKGPTASSVPTLALSTLHERFFELTIINSLGTGAIIGAFTEGRARYGIVHSLGLVAATTVLFLFIFP